MILHRKLCVQMNRSRDLHYTQVSALFKVQVRYTFVALLEFESEGLEHFVCSCHCILHRFEPSTRIRGGEIRELVTLGSWTLDALVATFVA